MSRGLTLENIRIETGGTPLLSIDDHIGPGEVLTVMGPSGSGKSTLLNVVIGAALPEFHVTGRVLLNGQDVTLVPPQARGIGILFQDDLLFPHMSVGANLAFGLRPGGTRAERRAKTESALAEVDLAGFAGRDPGTLSGGQKSRVALMRMLLSDPRALLLDEPFSRLDADLRRTVRELVFAKARDRGLPVLLVTHDEEDARAAGGRIIRLGGPTRG